MTRRNSQIDIIIDTWEKITAAQAIDYLEEAQSYFGTDDAKYLHELSEAYTFILSLKYIPIEDRLISYSQIDNLLTNTIGDNFWDVTNTDLTNAINELDSIYGF